MFVVGTQALEPSRDPSEGMHQKEGRTNSQNRDLNICIAVWDVGAQTLSQLLNQRPAPVLFLRNNIDLV